MTPPDDFERFSNHLDQEWMRDRLRATLSGPDDATEAELLRAVGRADPLAKEGPAARWWESLRLLLAPWPARVSVGAAVVVLLLIGVVVGRGLDGRGDARVTQGLPPLPTYTPDARVSLGVGPATNPHSQEKFREAMRFHPTRDFPAKALPLLREAVALDPANDEAQFWLGVALLSSDRPQEAVAPLEQAVRLAPASALYKQYLVFAYLRTGAIGRATALLTELMKAPR